jgi:hypothetical protein
MGHHGLRHWGGEGGRHGYGLAARWGDRGEGATDREGDGGGDTRLFTSFPRTAVFCIGTLLMLRGCLDPSSPMRLETKILNFLVTTLLEGD